MKTYLVTFTASTVEKQSRLVEGIKSYGTWGRIQNSVWVIVTDKTAVEVRDHLDAFLDAGDRLFVLKSAGEAAWRNTEAESEWLKKHL